MKRTDIIEGIHKGCGGWIKIYPQNSPPASAPYLVACIKCGDYYQTDTPPKLDNGGGGEIQ